jgi:hypothetical protein
MEPRLKLSKKSSAPAVDTTAYRSIVGSLRYLVNTRPDLAYTVGYVSRFMEEPTTEHLAAVKRVLRYVAGTLDYDCHYTRKKDAQLVGFSDSDLAGDIDTRKSTTGVVFFLGNNIITWQSQKQKVVALSSCERLSTSLAQQQPARECGWRVSLASSRASRRAQSRSTSTTSLPSNSVRTLCFTIAANT